MSVSAWADLLSVVSSHTTAARFRQQSERNRRVAALGANCFTQPAYLLPAAAFKSCLKPVSVCSARGGGPAKRSPRLRFRWPSRLIDDKNDEPASYRNFRAGALGGLWRPVSGARASDLSEPRGRDAALPRGGGCHEALGRRRARFWQPSL